MVLNLYKILGVHINATNDDINNAYKQKAHLYHPDKGGSPDDFKIIKSAKETLLDEQKRREYNKQLFDIVLVPDYYQNTSDGVIGVVVLRPDITGYGKLGSPLIEGKYKSIMIDNKKVIIPIEDEI